MKILTIIFLLVVPSILVAGEIDTLSYYKKNGHYVHYRDSDLELQAARFVLQAPGLIRSINITLGGESRDGSVMIHLFGHEGGLSAPLLQKDLIAPIRVAKAHPGVETVTVNLPTPLHINNNQFFVGIDKISKGVTLLSDKIDKYPNCTSNTDAFYYQFLRFGDKSWRWGPYAFIIDVVIEYPELAPRSNLVNITSTIGLRDSLMCNQSIAWADMNGDNYLDLLVDGKLYKNVQGKRFEDVTMISGLGGEPLANAFGDFNNDGLYDILFLGSHDSSAENAYLFINTADNRFIGQAFHIDGLVAPSSFSIADADGDGSLDLFIGQSRKGQLLPNLLLRNDRSGNFTDKSHWLYSANNVPFGSRGSQWIDYNGDRRPDLFVVSSKGENELWEGRGDSSFVRVLLESIESRGHSGGGCDWRDYDNDGDFDLLLPTAMKSSSLMKNSAPGTSIYNNTGYPDYRLVGGGSDIEYEEKQAGGAWGDINNDGLLDFIATTSCSCRYADIYIQEPGGNFRLGTFESGLQNIAASNDAVWVDFDNDGLLDLMAVDNGRLQLFRNDGEHGGKNFVEIDLSPLKGSEGAVGATVELHAGSVTYTQQVHLGRGLLVGNPPRLHFGVDKATVIDSIRVYWPNSSNSETFRSLAVNTLHRIGRESRQTSPDPTAFALQGFPNPFSASLTIQYSVLAEQRVRIEVYTVEGQKIVTLLDDKVLPGDHSVTWNARDQQGHQVPQGTYVYRLVAAGGELTGSAVLVQ